jgi:predicted ATPase
VGPENLRPHWLALLAEASGEAGQPEAGLTVLDEAFTRVVTMGAHWWEAELSRRTGVLRLQLPSPEVSRADASFQQALAVTRGQGAKAQELRAAMSLARLWQRQGQQAEARALLASIYGWFTEGFDTADL